MSDNNAPIEFEGRIAPGKDWKEIVAWVGDLPPLPQIASQAMVLIEDPNVSTSRLTDLLGKDTALAARVLKIANSAMFSFQREITTLNQAIVIIGFKSLKGIIVAATLRQINRKQGQMEQMIWQNSTCTAVAAHSLCTSLKKNFADEAYLAGLLHDLGKLVLTRQIPEDYEKVIKSAHADGCPFHVTEADHLGFSHPLIGALVAKKWNFSSEMCQMILHHHDALESIEDTPLGEKIRIIMAANLIAHKLGYGHKTGYIEQNDELNKIYASFGISEEQVVEIEEKIKDLYLNQSGSFG